MYNENENYQDQSYPPQEPERETQFQHTWNYGAEFTPQEPKKKEKKPLSAGKLIAIALCCSLVGGILGVIGGSLLTNAIKAPSEHTIVLDGQRENTVIDINKIDTSKIMTPAEVYATNVNSTVGITTSITTNYWGYQTTSAASGSGFVLTADGYILTNHHVIEGSNAITVSFYDGTSKDATLIGYDVSNDIAVLKVEATDLTPVVLGDSANINVGDTVVAIGNPLGELTFSLTVGALSALDREVTTSNGITMNLMQTDCAINSGNSGGALFNLYGEVIGITNAKYSGSSVSGASIDNIGFAIPINSVRSIVDSIIEKGYVAKPYIGVMVADVSDEAKSYGTPAGAAVASVTEGGPAEKAGLQANDIITAVNGKEISGKSDLSSIIADCTAGDKLTLSVYRQGQTLTVTVTVGEQTTSALANQQQRQQSQQSQQQQTMPDIFGFGG